MAGNAGKGRPKGSRNKATAALKDAILKALDEEGGVKYLRTLATEHPPAFAQLLGKILPMQVSGEGGGPLTVQVVNFASDHPPA